MLQRCRELAKMRGGKAVPCWAQLLRRCNTSDSLQTGAQGSHSALLSMHSCAAGCTSSWQKARKGIDSANHHILLHFFIDSWEMTTIIKRRCASI